MTETPIEEVMRICRENNVDAAIVDLSRPIVDASTVHVVVFESLDAALEYMNAKRLHRQLNYLALLKAAGYFFDYYHPPVRRRYYCSNSACEVYLWQRERIPEATVTCRECGRPMTEA